MPGSILLIDVNEVFKGTWTHSLYLQAKSGYQVCCKYMYISPLADASHVVCNSPSWGLNRVQGHESSTWWVTVQFPNADRLNMSYLCIWLLTSCVDVYTDTCLHVSVCMWGSEDTSYVYMCTHTSACGDILFMI